MWQAWLRQSRAINSKDIMNNFQRKILVKVAICLSIFLISACGGGGGGGGSSAAFDLIKEIFDNTMVGGYQTVGSSINDGLNSSGSVGCGFSANDANSQPVADSKIIGLGGKVNSSTPVEYCATVNGEVGCFKKIEKAYIEDGRSGASIIVNMTLTGLVQNHETRVDFNSVNNYATMESVTKNSSITTGVNCPYPTGTQTADAINGAWSGYKISYNTNTKSGVSAVATVNCSGQVCTVTDGTTTTATLSTFSNYGVWRTASGASKFSGASISSDKLLLSMFVCSAPLDESKTFDSCAFYTLKR